MAYPINKIIIKAMQSLFMLTFCDQAALMTVVFLGIDYYYFTFESNTLPPPVWGGTVAQSVERASPDEEVVGSNPAVATRSLLVGSVSV